MTEQILKGIRIIEFGWAVVGPLTTSWAGNYGAEVIKIESSTRPDIIRSMTPFKDDRKDIDTSVFFGRENASKKSMSLNLKKPEAVDLARQLIAKSDIVLDSYTSGVMAKYGLGYDDLKILKPDIIMLSSCMYGQTGALRKMPGYGVPLTAVSGLTSLCGWPDRPPVGPYGAYTDYLVPRLNLVALASALDYRRRTGKGLYLDASQLEASIQFVAPMLLDYQVNGRIARGEGNSSPQTAPHGVYRCQGDEEWCAIAVFDRIGWQQFCQALDNPDWTSFEKFATAERRKQNEAELDANITAWTEVRPAREVMDTLQQHGIAAGVVNNGRDLSEDPHLHHQNYYRSCKHTKMGPVNYPEHSITFSDAEQKVEASPCMGEHTEAVCRDIIGLDSETYRTYLNAGIFE